MEIKTCEDYVVTRVMNLDNRVEEQEALINHLREELNKVYSDLDYVKSALRITVRNASASDGRYVNVDNGYVWDGESRGEKEQFDRLVEIFGLSIPPKEEEEEE